MIPKRQIPMVFCGGVFLAASQILPNFRIWCSVPTATGAAVAPGAAAAAAPSGRHAALAVREKPVASREVGGAKGSSS